MTGGMMTEIRRQIETLNLQSTTEKTALVADVAEIITEKGYSVAEIDDTRPWGAFVRLENFDGDDFVYDFFDGLDAKAARLGDPNAELSPKILIVSPEQRLSWQYHNRRAEKWLFLNAGGYYRSTTDELGNQQTATAGEVVQFSQGERHRLVGALGHYTLVAEIWQHTDPDELSNEDDIIRLQDDYRR